MDEVAGIGQPKSTWKRSLLLLERWKCGNRGSDFQGEVGSLGLAFHLPVISTALFSVVTPMLRFLPAAFFAHRFSVHLDTVCVVHQAIEDTIGNGWISDLFVPLRHR